MRSEGYGQTEKRIRNTKGEGKEAWVILEYENLTYLMKLKRLERNKAETAVKKR